MQTDEHKLIAFLKDELSPEEEAAIEARIHQDKDFAWVAERLHQALYVDQKSEEELIKFEKTLIDTAYQSANLSEKSTLPLPPDPLMNKWLLIFGSAAAAIFLIFFFWNNQPMPKNFLAQSYLVHYEDQLNTKGVKEKFHRKVDQAMALYRDQTQPSYQQAIPLFEYVLSHPDSITSGFELQEITLSYAVALVLTKQYQKAEAPLNSIINDKAREQLMSAKWYLALSTYQADPSSEQYQQLIEEIANSKNPYQSKAKSLLK